MRHLHFTQSLEPLQGGGLGSSSRALHREFLAQAVDSVLCGTYGGTHANPDFGCFEFRRTGPDFIYFSLDMQRRAAGLVRQSDILHGHGLYVGPNWIFGHEARRQRKALVYHVHGMFEPYILGRSQWKKQLVHWLFENANFRTVRLWRALTSKEADQIRACGISAPIVVAPNGINLADYAARTSHSQSIETPLIPHFKKTALRLLFLGRIHPKKGLNVLLRVWAQLGEEFPNWQLVMAGPDEQGHAKSLRRLAASLGIEDRLRFTGQATGQTKLDLLYSADLFVLPSISEGFPMSLLEAMACQLPVIATHACNIPEIAASGAGWECDATPESLYSALRAALLASTAERKQRGETGRALVQRQYTWSKIVPTLLQACAQFC